MAFPLPTSLSPSKVASFKECALAFRLSSIDRLPEPPSPWAAKGTLVHRALELLFWEEPAGRRTLPVALEKLERARCEVLHAGEYEALDLGDEEDAFIADAGTLLRNYFELEDPNTVTVLGTELMLEADLGGVRLRGIIDRLEVDADGEFVITDYKTGKAPATMREGSRLAGVHFYAFLCEQVFGRRPARVQLLHLREPVAISTAPSAQSTRGLELRARAVWQAIELACEREDFRPKTSWLCSVCAYKPHCPAFGGTLPVLTTRADGDPGAPAALPTSEAVAELLPVPA